jgi:hypothetical protein
MVPHDLSGLLKHGNAYLAIYIWKIIFFSSHGQLSTTIVSAAILLFTIKISADRLVVMFL